jgi:DNA polymerase III delta prime subunit
MYAEKYKPRVLEEVLGHATEIAQLRRWLGPSADDPTAPKKPVCLIGPPGIGKTTIAHLLAAQAGYIVHELNASDSRTSTVLKNTLHTTNTRLQPDLIIIDEVDTIQDHGGITTLSTIIKTNTHIPIVLIANERPIKVRTILSNCIEIVLYPPPLHTIVSHVEKIGKKEGLRIPKAQLQELCTVRDLRSILNNLMFVGASSATDASKDMTYDIFTATKKIINQKDLDLGQAFNIVESDAMMVPAMIEEAYVGASRSLETAVRAADYITHGTIIDRRIHRVQDWSLLPYYSASAIAAARTVEGPAPYNLFPSWLGKHSSTLKKRRDLQELGRTLVKPTRQLRLDIIDLVDKMIASTTDGKSAVELLNTLGISRDMYFDIIREITLEPAAISTKTKTAITRFYNKQAKSVRCGGPSRAKPVKLDMGPDDVDIADDVEYTYIQ